MGDQQPGENGPDAIPDVRCRRPTSALETAVQFLFGFYYFSDVRSRQRRLATRTKKNKNKGLASKLGSHHSTLLVTAEDLVGGQCRSTMAVSIWPMTVCTTPWRTHTPQSITETWLEGQATRVWHTRLALPNDLKSESGTGRPSYVTPTDSQVRIC